MWESRVRAPEGVQYAQVVELVDTLDLESSAIMVWEFESLLGYK